MLFRQPVAAQNMRAPLLLVALLLLSLGTTTVLAWEASQAEKSHLATAEGALRDYSKIAAFLYARQARADLYRTAIGVLVPFEEITLRSAGESLPGLREALSHHVQQCKNCPRPDSVRRIFRIDFRDGTSESTATPLQAGLQRWIADTVAVAHRSPREPGPELRILVPRVGRHESVIAYLLIRDPAGRPAALFGFEAEPVTFVRAAMRPVWRSASVIPHALSRGARSDSLLSLTVSSPHGRRLFATPRQYISALQGGDTVGARMGGLQVRVTLRPETAGRLLIGGIPQSRMPFLLGTLALTLALTVVALVQLGRERELVRVRADFVASVSHELRTPLAQIRMFAETLILRRVRSREERNRSFRIIDQEARRLVALVDNVLRFAQAERRAVSLEKAALSLDTLVRDAVDSFTPLATARGVTIVPIFEPGVVAEVDPGALQQVLLNLLDNAVKYGPPGQTVSVGLGRRGGRACLWVDDEGPGLPERERKRVFRPFVRLARETGRAVAGSGIGLAVVHELVKLHGGRVWVEEAPGGGARFIVQL